MKKLLAASLIDLSMWFENHWTSQKEPIKRLYFNLSEIFEIWSRKISKA